MSRKPRRKGFRGLGRIEKEGQTWNMGACVFPCKNDTICQMRADKQNHPESFQDGECRFRE